MLAWHGCKPEYVQDRNECTPARLDGGRLTVNATPTNNFVDVSKRLENGSYVIATKHRVSSHMNIVQRVNTLGILCSAADRLDGLPDASLWHCAG